MAVAAEGAGADAALTAGCSVSSSRLRVSVERPGRCAGTVENSTAPAVCSAACDSPRWRMRNSAAAAVKLRRAACHPVEGVPVIKRSAPGVVPAVVINCVSVMPIESPMTPAPSKTAEQTDSEADSEREVRAAKPNSGIRVPSRPRRDRILRKPATDRTQGRKRHRD